MARDMGRKEPERFSVKLWRSFTRNSAPKKPAPIFWLLQQWSAQNDSCQKPD